ncbi:MAG: 3-phosphoshikimate 1-carboxyvinyltransferase [Lentisphaerae bacterium RIFOXYB12_FULL_65_16]|nr:MAG: 3-phosphoshikimate 1-carboxyvinyltransferase [Lentisphaerae bacterium RIFOXYA12_64_32]OGV88421.1 MAG: 3-phosphoshikimate 1-carboxyvinyltransferase [Lentisphaerae bacterium RIFOXYB12_FULL_65_16]
MKFVCHRSALRGQVEIPGSKSHTIRAVCIGALAAGESVIHAPLVSGDALSAVQAATGLGAAVDMQPGVWRIRGCGNRPRAARAEIDVGNSGTTLYIALGMASLLRDGQVVLTGDAQIQRRPAGPLAKSLCDLGGEVVSQRGNGCAPYAVRGGLRGGETAIAAPTSQYVTSLLLNCPLATGDSTVNILLLNERPYVQMTLDWLAGQGVRVEHDNMMRFRIPGNQGYRAFEKRIPADFSSATFFLGAGALGGNAVTSLGLDMADSQADKAVVRYLEAMGAGVTVEPGRIMVQARPLHGVEIDMNETPDALPVMAVMGCFARGETRLRNVEHARIKETDRIAVMCCELRKLGADIAELPDGLVIRESALRGAAVEGHDDHRVVMALALAGLHVDGTTTVATAEAAAVTFPDFADKMHQLGANLAAVNE